MAIRFLETGPEANKHTRYRSRFSDEWMTIGLSDKTTVDIEQDLNEDWKVESNSFDIVFGSHVLEHMRDPMHYVFEANRVLRKGGVLKVSVPSVDSLINYYKRGRYDLFKLIRNLRSWHGAPLTKAHWHPFDSESLILLIKKGYYRLLGFNDADDSNEIESIFDPVEIFLPKRIGRRMYEFSSFIEMLKDPYFNSRCDRSIFCEGIKI